MWPTLWLKLDFHHHRLLPIWFSRQIMKTATTTTFKKNYVSRVSRSSRRDWFEGGCCTHRAHQPDTRHSCGFLTHHQRVRDKRKIILYHFVRWFFFYRLIRLSKTLHRNTYMCQSIYISHSHEHIHTSRRTSLYRTDAAVVSLWMFGRNEHTASVYTSVYEKIKIQQRKA